MDNPFSWDYLTTVPGTDEVFGPFAVAYLVLFGLGFIVSIFLYNDGARLFTRHAVRRRVLRRGAGIAMIVFSVGLFFFAIRLLQINPFNFGMRLWLWLSFLAALIMFGYFAYYLRMIYPELMREHEERRVKAQYLRPTGSGPVRYEPRRLVRRKVRR